MYLSHWLQIYNVCVIDVKEQVIGDDLLSFVYMIYERIKLNLTLIYHQFIIT